MRRFTPDDVAATADLVVIGGGITGAATARDAALRGLSVVLVERDDFASGTSSRSSKLIHGGLRYLQSYQFRLVHEAVRERELMLRLGPHLGTITPFLYLLYDGYPEGRWLLRAGLTFYDLFSRAPRRRWHRMLGRDQVLEREPRIRADGLTGAGLFHDLATDDTRVVCDTLRSAVEAGAMVANHREVVGLIRERGRVRGVEVVDRLTGEHFEIRSRAVVNTTGPWVDRLRRLEDASAPRLLRPTKGVHIVVPREAFPIDHALFLRSPDDGRVVWPIPALDGRHIYIGTTDTDYDGPLDAVHPDDADFEYLLRVANHTMPDAHLDASHVVAAWAGLRPLVAPEDEMAASSVSRDHQIVVGPDGMVTIAGGKLTTARVMAQQLVDRVGEILREEHGLPAIPVSSTATVPLSGGDPTGAARAAVLLERNGASDAVTARLVTRYGSNALHHAARLEKDPASGTALDDTGLSRVEVELALESEMARTVSDVLIRRTGTSTWPIGSGSDTAERVSRLVADHLDLDETTRIAQLNAYRAEVARNLP